MESPNLLDFLYQNLGLILAILGLAYVVIKFLLPRKAPSIPEPHLSQTDIAESEAAGERASEDVRARYGKYFGGKKP